MIFDYHSAERQWQAEFFDLIPRLPFPFPISIGGRLLCRTPSTQF
jgi:hypothetical protein